MALRQAASTPAQQLSHWTEQAGAPAQAEQVQAFNDKAITDKAKTDKWFKPNCKNVLSPECSAQEKASAVLTDAHQTLKRPRHA
jgi:hypothetical protein